MVSSSSWVWRSMTCSFSTLSSSTAVRELIHCKSTKFHISVMYSPLEPRKQALAISLSSPAGNSGRASSFVTTHGHFTTAHMHNVKAEKRRVLLERNYMESSQKTAVDKWQSTRALVLLVYCLCSSTLSIQRCQSQDNYTTHSQVITLCWFSTHSQVQRHFQLVITR